MKQTKIVLDTSIFVNPDARCHFGATPKKALSEFLDIVADKKQISCYIPPSVYEELSSFIEKMPSEKKTTIINKKPPSSYQSSVPAILVYEFIEEMRSRINKGLRIAEKYSRRALSAPHSTDKQKDEDLIKTLRQEYRAALREGVIDSRQDFDLILLAKELDAHIATVDGGLVTWAQKLGITCINAKELKEIIS
ncbi:MAG: RNA ligase partner protein [Candidatus Omnitrophica bacterium]|nr:RNA ligase partner protein [Candidatus Omnitrophota bacterium]